MGSTLTLFAILASIILAVCGHTALELRRRKRRAREESRRQVRSNGLSAERVLASLSTLLPLSEQWEHDEHALELAMKVVELLDGDANEARHVRTLLAMPTDDERFEARRRRVAGALSVVDGECAAGGLELARSRRGGLSEVE